jgi:hypothetical protein
LALAVEQDANFSALSTGLCYNYYGEAPTGGGSVTDTLLFNYYNGTIVYPCGTSPEELVSSQISAVVDSSTGLILSLQMSNGSALNPRVPCDPNSSPVSVVSVQDVESTIPAVPQLNLTLAANAGARPITKLVASLTLDGGKQVFQFDVSQNARLLPGQASSKIEIVLATVSFNPDEEYPLTISGSFDSGQAFSYSETVQIASIP